MCGYGPNDHNRQGRDLDQSSRSKALRARFTQAGRRGRPATEGGAGRHVVGNSNR